MKIALALLTLTLAFAVTSGGALAADLAQSVESVKTKAASVSDKTIAKYTALKAKYQGQLDTVNSKLDAMQADPKTKVAAIDKLKAKKADLQAKVAKYQGLIDKAKASAASAQSAIGQNTDKAKAAAGSLGGSNDAAKADASNAMDKAKGQLGDLGK